MDMLGWTVKDCVTGFAGVVVGQVRYISGCNQCLVAPKAADDGVFRESQWFDEQRLDSLPAERIVLNNGATPGADRSAPKR